MPDVFGSVSAGFGGAFKSTLAALTLSATGSENGVSQLLVTNLEANYLQEISRIYEVSSSLAYYVVGQPSGKGSFGSVFGPKNVAAAAYAGLADPCNDSTITLAFSGDTVGCASDRTTPLLHKYGRQLVGVVVLSAGVTVNAQDMAINEDVGFEFAALEILG